MNDSKPGSEWLELLADPNQQFDKRSVLLASIEAYSKAVPATALGFVDDERATVLCDEACGAFEEPQTLDEYRASLEHWRRHHEAGGCSHGG